MRNKYIPYTDYRLKDIGEISDGYHTFNELYYYRMLYNAAFFNLLPKEWVHKSKKHHTGEECFGGGWFIVIAELPTGQISNHYESKYWDLFDIPEKEIADKWDGHSPQEAAERIHKFLLEKQAEQQETLCDKCRREQPSHSCQDITELGRCELEHQRHTEEIQLKEGDKEKRNTRIKSKPASAEKAIMKREQIEKKSEELGIKYQTPCHGVGDCEFEARQAAMEMAEWLLAQLEKGGEK